MAILLSTLSCSGQGQKIPDKKTMSVIKKAEKVEYYALDPWSEDFSNGTVCGAAIVGKGIDVSDSNKDTLYSLIRETISNYNPTGAMKMSEFIPDCAFIYVNGSDTVYVTLDFHADLVNFTFDKRISELSFGKTKDKFDALISDIITTNGNKADSSKNTKTYLPKSVSDAILSADSLSIYTLDAMDKSDDSTKNFNNSLILLQKNVSDIDSIKAVLTMPTGINNSELYKECVFMPDLGIRFYCLDNQTVEMTFSFYCGKCEIVSSGKTFIFDCDAISQDIIRFAKKTFPTDKYLRMMSNQ